MPLSVRTVWILYGAALTRAVRKAAGDAGGLVHQLDEGELAGPVDSNEEIELSFGGLYLGDVDVEEPATELRRFHLAPVFWLMP